MTLPRKFFIKTDEHGVIVEAGDTDEQAFAVMQARDPAFVEVWAPLTVGEICDLARRETYPRPPLSALTRFDKTTIAAGVETAAMPNVPAGAKVVVPDLGEQVHGGGDLVIGFRTPGTYEVRIEAYPWAPTTFPIEVTP